MKNLVSATPLVVAFVVLYGVFIGFPHKFTDWYWRPQFVQGCVLGAGGALNDAVLQYCNDAYYKQVAVQERGWRAFSSN